MHVPSSFQRRHQAPKPSRRRRALAGVGGERLQAETHRTSMRGTARFLVENATRKIRTVDKLARLMSVTAPQKHEEISASESIITKDENVEPIVAFSRPPPLPPVLGPLIMFSLFEMSSSDEDNK